MKRKFLIFAGFLCFVSTALMSCATAITTVQTVKPYELSRAETDEKLEYIGLKVDQRVLGTTVDAQTGYSEFDWAQGIKNSPTTKKIGYNLENAGIAIDKSFAYFGVYELQEMAIYKNVERYVTFVEVEKNNIKYKDTGSSKTLWGSTAGGMLGAGIPLMILGGVTSNLVKELGAFTVVGGVMSGVGLISAIVALTPSKTTITFDGSYNVYIYDTQEKKIIRKDPVTLKRTDEFKGSFTYDDASRQLVWNYYGELVSNAILEKYEELGRWVQTLE